ncbi:glutamate ligase domain-containing protein [Patescibacteria group bacterium]
MVRRFDVSEKNGVTFIDDYAHHPTACRLTTEAAKKRFPEKNVICVFQPHMVSRTKEFKDEFAQAFRACDEIIIADIFASARESSDGYTSKDLVDLMQKYHPAAQHGGSLDDIIQELQARKLTSRDVVMTMGAGDVYKIIDSLK